MKKFLLSVVIVFASTCSYGQISGNCAVSTTSCTKAQLSLTGQNAAIASFGSPTALFTPSTSGQYRITLNSYLTTVGTAGSIQVCIAYQTISGTTTATCAGTLTTTATLGTQGTAVNNSVISARVVAGSIGYYTTYTAATGAVYAFDITIEQVQSRG